MTTRTDFQMIRALDQAFNPMERGILSGAEVAAIQEGLEIASRTDLELQNLRDMVAMWYSIQIDRADDDNDTDKALRLMDKMSGIASVIDAEKWRRGMAV